MEVGFFDFETFNPDGRTAGTRSLSPDDIYITMGRNEITVVKYVYVKDSGDDDFLSYILINDHWEGQHNMDIE